jgi:hypothetical protein
VRNGKTLVVAKNSACHSERSEESTFATTKNVVDSSLALGMTDKVCMDSSLWLGMTTVGRVSKCGMEKRLSLRKTALVILNEVKNPLLQRQRMSWIPRWRSE